MDISGEQEIEQVSFDIDLSGDVSFDVIHDTNENMETTASPFRSGLRRRKAADGEAEDLDETKPRVAFSLPSDESQGSGNVSSGFSTPGKISSVPSGEVSPKTGSSTKNGSSVAKMSRLKSTQSRESLVLVSAKPDGMNKDLIFEEKTQEFEKISEWVVPFFFSLTTFTPLLLALFPLTAVYLIIQSKSKKSAPKPSTPATPANAFASTNIKRPSDEEFKARPYDLILYGATGFTGKKALDYLANVYKKDAPFKYAIAGRNREALENLVKELKTKELVVNIDIIIANATNDEELVAMVKKSRVIITTAGPFCQYGSQLVKACAENGTHYCDITGETDWVRQMIDLYDDAARVSGAKIISFCGHDCIPWDLCVYKISKAIEEASKDKEESEKEELAEVSCFDEIKFEPSGGTLATSDQVLLNRVPYKSRLGFDPLYKSQEGPDGKTILSPYKLTMNNSWKQWLIGYDSDHEKYTGPFIMSMVMANCVRRSNTLGKYSKNLKYRELQAFPNFFAAYINVIIFYLFGYAFLFPPTKYLLKKYLLPKQGEGPPEDRLDKGYLKVTAHGLGNKGSRYIASIYFPTDAGYRDTARMLVESGLSIALDEKICALNNGGCLTPATALGDTLLNRLTNGKKTETYHPKYISTFTLKKINE